MKKLTRLLLINWHYFQNTIIDFGTINFLTGKNSAGKSTIIDALQVVLMGETRSTAFNRAASKKSERTLKSYLVGSMGEDVENGNKSIREGKDFSTYIVAEFYDDFKSDFFCLGAVFDTFSDGGDINKRFFYLKSLIPECRFIEDGKTMDIRRMTQFFKDRYHNKFETKDTADGYKKIVLSKLNIHDPKFILMLKKAISFEPINDIEKFITENVCDIEDDIDITAMQENILNYKQQEIMAESFEKRLRKLDEICNLYSEIEKLRSTYKIQQFLIDYSTYQDFILQLENAHANLDKYNEHIKEFADQYNELKCKIARLEEEKEELTRTKNKYLSDNNFEWLQSENDRLLKELEEYSKKLSLFTVVIKTASTQWLDKLSHIYEPIVNEEDINDCYVKLKSKLERTEKFSERDFELLSPEFFGDTRAMYISLKRQLQPIYDELQEKLRKLQSDSEVLKNQIKALKNGVKPYPRKAEMLKSAITEGLKRKYNKDISVDFLADLIDVTDEEWHDAVEGYLNTQRMNIIVPPQYFMDAFEIYKEVRKKENIHEYAIVDLQKAYEFGYSPKKNSLAEVVYSEDKYVQSYVNYLLGKVIRCYSDDKLRDYRTSITKECMLYHNFAVKPINKDAYTNPYIGRKSIEKQIETKTTLLEKLNNEISENNNKVCSVNPIISDEWFLTENYISSTVVGAFSDYENKNITNCSLQEIQQTLDNLDLFWLEEMERKIKNKKVEIAVAIDKKEETATFIHEFELERDNTVSMIIPSLEKSVFESEQKVNDRYTREYQEEAGIPRFETELAERNTPAAVKEKFIIPVQSTLTKIHNNEGWLREKRSAYNSEEKTSYNASDVHDNSEYNKAYEQIKDYELPKYRERIERAKNEAMEQFKSDFLYKLRANIQSACEKIDELNKALKIAQFGNDTYKFKVEPNPAYFEYYEMIMSDLLENGNVGLFSFAFTERYQTVIDNLFSQIISLDGDSGKTAQNVELFSKYKTYLSFDLLSIDSNGRTDRLSKSIFTKSGGETQTPFYIAVLASFAQLYKVNDNNEYGNTARLVIFDEAFNKMDGERIIESVRLLRKFGLQAIICSPPEKVADIAPVSDKTLLVHKEAMGNIYQSTVIEWTKEMSEM